MKSKQINIPDSKKEIVFLSIFPSKIVYCWMEIGEGGSVVPSLYAGSE